MGRRINTEPETCNVDHAAEPASGVAATALRQQMLVDLVDELFDTDGVPENGMFRLMVDAAEVYLDFRAEASGIIRNDLALELVSELHAALVGPHPGLR